MSTEKTVLSQAVGLLLLMFSAGISCGILAVLAGVLISWLLTVG